MLSRHRKKGFSLIEVMVALIILSIGFAGYAALQLIGIRSVEDSYLRSQATVLAEEMAERMRANRLAFGVVVANQSEYHGRGFVRTAVDICETTQETIIDAQRCESDGDVGAGTNCTPQQMAQYDVARVFCGYEATNGNWTGGVRHLSEGAGIVIECCAGVGGACSDDPPALPMAAANCPTGTPHRIFVQWLAQETDQDDTADQDGDGDNSLATQVVRVTITP